MVLLTLSQGDVEAILAAFDTIENGRKFANMIPGYSVVEEEVEEVLYTYETINPLEIPQYFEIKYNGNVVPLSSFMFPSDERVDVFWSEITNMDVPNQGMAKGGTRVDAYIPSNEQVKAYIEKRESGYNRASYILQELGYIPGRDYRGSEDGEAIVLSKNGDGENRILTYLDPEFIKATELDDEKFYEWVIRKIEETR
ncbi:MAG: hypothetical protein GXZ11_05970 [Tissierellia bacterium]|nr:hypothetical protein [Tissierellia bacterium]